MEQNTIMLAFEKEKSIFQKIQASIVTIQKTQIKNLKQHVQEEIKKLEKEFKKTGEEVLSLLQQITLVQPLPTTKRRDIPEQTKKEQPKKKILSKEERKRELYLKNLHHLGDLDKETLKRLKKPKKVKKKGKEKEASLFVRIANKSFYNLSTSLLKNTKYAHTLRKQLIQSNLRFIPENYVSVMIFSTLVSFIAAFFVFLFFLFFSFSATFPIITLVQESISSRILKFFWILIVIPLGTLIFTYLYPSLEKSSLGRKIDGELAFATIHMAAIAGSMINPSEIFRIISLTNEYPHLGKELNKLLNEMNVYGHDLVSALRRVAMNSPSKDLSDLLNGLAITITSGGDLPEFFEKRSQTLLFEHRLEREKRIKSSETFMDIYISVVIAAPMILMLVLMMMKISGLGVSLSTTLITIIMVVGVTIVNIIFLTFLHLKQSTE